VKDVLLSGGDPLTLADVKLFKIIERILSSGSVETLRVCTRAPAVEPDRITEAFAKQLASFEGVWMVTHFNHPAEFDERAALACRRLVSNGVPVLNQTVLLKGVNDDHKTLERLFRTLAKHRVRPHYLFHADPVRGAAHFATARRKASKYSGPCGIG
jgi:lysine 2,3-aminomutase